MIQMNPNPTPPNWREELVIGILAVTQRKFLIIVILISVVSISAANWFMIKPFYQASGTIVLLPREKPILDIAARSDSLESTDDTARRAPSASLTLPPNPDLYITLMKSGDLASRISQRLKPMHDLTASQIRHGIEVSSSDTGLMTVTCQAPSPEAAAKIAGFVIEECKETSKSIERQLILQQTGYFDGAVKRMKSQVDLLTDRINSAAEEFGVSDPELAASRSIARLRRLDEAQIRLETHLHGLSIHRTNVDPLVAALQGELESVYIARDIVSKNFCGLVSEGAYSSMLAKWKGLHQELGQAQDMHMSLTAKRDLFMIRAEQPSGNIAIIQIPNIPTAPAGPSKRRAISIALLIGVGVSIMSCVIFDQISRMKEQESGRVLLHEVVVSCTPRILHRRESS